MSGQGAVIDIKNGYLRTTGDGEQTALTVCLIKRPDHSYLVAVSANRTPEGIWKPFLDFYRYQLGRLVRAAPSPLPHQFGRQFGYRLPRYGTTIQVVSKAGQPVLDLVWERGRFQRGSMDSRRLVPPISPASVLPKSLREEREYPSPDRRYAARLRHDEGDVWNLAVVDARSRRRVVEADDVQNLLWVPGKGHRLVVAACGVYGEAMLGQWDGGSRWRALHTVRHPDGECFMLYGVTRDGRSIVYGHDPDLNGSRSGDRDPMDRRRWVRLRP